MDDVLSTIVNLAVTYLPPSVLQTLLSPRKRKTLLRRIGVVVFILAAARWYARRGAKAERDRLRRIRDKTAKAWNYDQLRALLKHEDLTAPLTLVDLDVFESNARLLTLPALSGGKRVRLATKSLRVPWLIRQAVQASNGAITGLMCYSVQEAAFLASLTDEQLAADQVDAARVAETAAVKPSTSQQSVAALAAWNKDLLVAYPTVDQKDLDAAADLLLAGVKLTLMIDSLEHIDRLETFVIRRKRIAHEAAEGVSTGPAAASTSANVASVDQLKLRVCIDVDMSLRLFGGALHFGVHRSSCRTIQQFSALVTRLQASPHLQLVGVMGYEAQVAGLPDNNAYQRCLNPIKSLIKAASMRFAVVPLRQQVAALLSSRNIRLEFFNGGGSGNVAETSRERSLTEVTIGSGILQSRLFDYYRANECIPAFAFALFVTRKPDARSVTCQSGGFIASGATSSDKQPTPFLPAGYSTYAHEGFGEVQTPLVSCSREARQTPLALGDPVFFRPAKAGELAEHFREYHLKRGNRALGSVRTYRGHEQKFF
ncbi:hypothetical protein CAOG_06907 [Capsaspora owczarzaki ATCC 30864]|uniref:Alanine racemase N-terminal domain-containing protein n=1 Tax=Capsaspora owczarzaki (strain ATCC 30864) TaxID=595528 RepID=A0A0D2VY61_CAPO3|nr:hypothetical protein CAOG_06907 [Capsaspora owczarzaki ATCC 30864]KJE96607.1 hypothetical protein CAOG_006907 [Capsaspora owczarzaki ATCC 30864]|eukprot:XP_004344528.2 hypothetical protein CAOG_06907 [Capsaspora owczarzaki ATCC 30864]